MADTMTLKAGTVLRNTYRIERVLGQGGFGITYLATHALLKKQVAIKEFFPKVLCNRDYDTSQVRTATDANSELVEKLRNKFLKEAEHIARMDSPNIVKIIDVFEENHTAYYIMEYIEGSSLSDMVKSSGPLSERQAVEYITKIGEALTYIHSKHINHLDVKPANIMVRRSDNEPILIDFGLSKQYDSEGNQTSTTPVGISHGYAPMEQYNDGGVKEFSPQTDLYSLAATLYYLLSGVVPPQATRLIDEELTFPASIPARLVTPISKAMSTSRRHRQETVVKFLQEIVPAHDTVIEPTPKPQPNPDPKPKPQPQTESKSTSVQTEKGYYIREGIVVAVILLIIFLFAFITPTCRSEPSIDYVADTTSIEGSNSEGEIPSLTESINGHNYVDLGLPSGLKWATCNVGASSPSDCGDYFAWGETETKSSYDEDNSTTYGKSVSEMRSAGIIGSDDNLTRSYDAAHANWGGSWRMPTKAECKELVDRCTWTWTTQGGHNGYKVTGPNGKSIFLPAAGCRNGASLYTVSELGDYCSSAPYEDDSNVAYFLSFDSSEHYVGWCCRSDGLSVRPVSE